ncbi:MAG: flippase-like domain-containing protein [Actinomycetota bacterium]|nr:flippase-like domain-containing protein [Actinomycetota bacterium]
MATLCVLDPAPGLDDRVPSSTERAGRAYSRRAIGRQLLRSAGMVFAVSMLLSQAGQARSVAVALSRARWPWLPFVGLASALTYLMAAVSLTGASTVQLALDRTWAVQVAAAFTNRLAPAGVGGMATNVRYLVAAGAERRDALATVGLSSLAGFVVHLVGVIAIVPLLGVGGHGRGPSLPHLPAPPLLLVALATLGAVAIVTRRHRVVLGVIPWLRSAAATARLVVCEPKRMRALLGGSAGVTAGYALGLIGSVQAMGGGVGVAKIVAVYLGGSAVAAVAPSPGGVGAFETVLAAGLTAVGMAPGNALGAVLVYRLVTYWLPILPGVVLYRRLRQDAVL